MNEKNGDWAGQTSLPWVMRGSSARKRRPQKWRGPLPGGERRVLDPRLPLLPHPGNVRMRLERSGLGRLEVGGVRVPTHPNGQRLQGSSAGGKPRTRGGGRGAKSGLGHPRSGWVTLGGSVRSKVSGSASEKWVILSWPQRGGLSARQGHRARGTEGVNAPGPPPPLPAPPPASGRRKVTAGARPGLRPRPPRPQPRPPCPSCAPRAATRAPRSAAAPARAAMSLG